MVCCGTVTKRAAMPTRFVTNKVVTNHAGTARFFLFFFFSFFFSHLDISTCDIVFATYMCVCVCVGGGGGMCVYMGACVKEREI